MKVKENWVQAGNKSEGEKVTGLTGNRRTYILEELLSQLLDVVHDFVWTGLLLSNPLHMIGDQLRMQGKEATLNFSIKLLVSGVTYFNSEVAQGQLVSEIHEAQNASL